MGTQLQTVTGEQVERSVLAPLREGKTVTLVVKDSKIRKRRGVDVILLMISPIRLYNIDSDGLLFSMPAYGCEVQQIGKLKVTQLYKMGLSMKSASVLVSKLNELFKE